MTFFVTYTVIGLFCGLLMAAAGIANSADRDEIWKVSLFTALVWPGFVLFLLIIAIRAMLEKKGSGE